MGGTFQGFEAFMGITGGIAGTLSVGLTLKDAVDGYRSVMDASVDAVARNTAGAGESRSTDTNENVDSTPILRMYLKEVHGDWENYDIILWKASFTIVLDGVEMDIGDPNLDEIYFGMPKSMYEIPGNKYQEGVGHSLKYKAMPSKESDFNKGVFTNDGIQYFHRARDLSQSSGCFLASRLPCRTDQTHHASNGQSFVSSDFHTSGTSEWEYFVSQKILFAIEEYYKNLQTMNSKIGFEFVIGESPANLIELEAILNMISIYAH